MIHIERPIREQIIIYKKKESKFEFKQYQQNNEIVSKYSACE